MKKYFSLIAVAMLAVASVFTSCSKDDAGSSYNPQVEPDETVTTDSTVLHSFMLTAVGRKSSSEATAEFGNALKTFFQNKLGTKATVEFDGMKLKIYSQDASGVKAIVKTTTTAELDAVVNSCKSMVGGTFNLYSNDNTDSSFFSYIYEQTIASGAVKATVDSKECSLTFDGATGTLVYDGQTYQGSIERQSKYVKFISSDKKLHLLLTFCDGTNNSAIGDLFDVENDKYIFENVNFTK